MSKKTAVYFLRSGLVNQENSIAIQGQGAKNREDSECDESDSLPLCYFSFELLRYICKIFEQAQNFEDMTCS